jgi:hypothetical protein
MYVLSEMCGFNIFKCNLLPQFLFNILFIYFPLFVLLCWGYIMAFIKVLIIYHTSFLNSPPPSFSFLPYPHLWNSFNRYHFHLHTCVYIIYTILTLLLIFKWGGGEKRKKGIQSGMREIKLCLFTSHMVVYVENLK